MGQLFEGQSKLTTHFGPPIFCLEDKHIRTRERGFPGGAVVENLPANAGDTGSSPDLGRSHMPWSK